MCKHYAHGVFMKNRSTLFVFSLCSLFALPGCLKKKQEEKKEVVKKTASVKRVLQKEMIEDTQNS